MVIVGIILFMLILLAGVTWYDISVIHKNMQIMQDNIEEQYSTVTEMIRRLHKEPIKPYDYDGENIRKVLAELDKVQTLVKEKRGYEW